MTGLTGYLTLERLKYCLNNPKDDTKQRYSLNVSFMLFIEILSN